MVNISLHGRPKQIDLSVAELIEWGYETSGDFEEALRVYTEASARAGFELQYTETELVRAREEFVHNFQGNRSWGI